VRSLRVALLLTIVLLFVPAHATAASSFSAETTVYFSPNGGTTAAIVRELSNTQHRILVQAYSVTSPTSVTSQYAKRPSCRMRSLAATESG
jgi:hypothetical protein